MKKNGVNGSLRLSEIIRWTLAGIFICLSFIYVGAVALWGIVLTLFMLVAFCFCEDDVTSNDMADIALVNGLFFTVFGFKGFFIAILPCVGYIAICALVYRRFHVLFLNAIIFLFGSLLFDMSATDWHHQTTYETVFEKDVKQFVQYTNDFNKIIKKNDVLADSEKVQISNPYFALPLLAEISNRQDQKQNQLKAQTDSLKTVKNKTIEAFLTQKKEDFTPILNQYMDKTEIVRVKRLWQNSEVLPWTYDAYTQIFFKMRSSRRVSSANLQMYGNASFTGENKLDYVNVIFSNNIYRRYLIKDHPEWLLVKEGDAVEMSYEYSKTDLNTNLCTQFGTSDFDILFKKNFVPLYKK